MSCDHELANKRARCSRKNASYITIYSVEMIYFFISREFQVHFIFDFALKFSFFVWYFFMCYFFQVFMGPPGTDPRGRNPGDGPWRSTPTADLRGRIPRTDPRGQTPIWKGRRYSASRLGYNQGFWSHLGRSCLNTTISNCQRIFLAWNSKKQKSWAFSIYKKNRKISIGNFHLGRVRSICHKSHSFTGSSMSLRCKLL